MVMRKIVYVLLTLAVCGTLSVYSTNSLLGVAQVVKPGDDIKTMYDNEQYQEIINQYAATPRTLSADELTYVAQSYLKLDDLTNAQKYADQAIQKDAKNARAFYVKGVINNMTGYYIQALTNLQKAIAISPRQSEYFTELGDAYLAQDNYVEALMNYRKAIKLPNPSEKAFYMIGAVYAGRDDMKNALDTFYVAKSKVVKDKELYVTLLYNIGKIEYDNKNYKKAVESYQELIEYFPDDYYSMEKMIQCYNALGYFARADVAKRKLYTAYEEGMLASTSMSDMFCIDRFNVESKEVSVYERFEEPTCRTFIKNIFYVANPNGNIESSIMLEYIPAEEQDAKGSYRLVMEKDNMRHTFNTTMDETIKYATLQSLITDIVNGKITPTPEVK